MKTGIFKDTSEVYHASEAIGSTSIKQMLTSPGHFYEAWRGPKKESKAFDEGNVVHSVLLEQDLSGYVRRPDGVDGRTKDGKAKLEELAATGKTVITADVYDSLERRLNTFVQFNEALSVYENAEIEKSHYAIDPVTGLYIKARPDILKPGFIGDVKTTQNMRLFENQIWNLGYFVQCGFYALVTEITTGKRVTEFKFIAQEKTAPYGVRVFKFDESTVSFCRETARGLLNRAAICIEAKEFPLFDDVVKQVTIPPWVFSNEMSLEEAV